MKMKYRTILLVVVVIIAVSGTCVYNAVFKKNNVAVKEDVVTIPENADFEQMMDSLKTHHVLLKENTFRWTCRLRHFKSPRRGHYAVKAGMNNMDLSAMLRRGQHYGVKFTFNNLRTKAQLIEKVENKFFFAPEELAALLSDSVYLSQYGFNAETCVAAFIPDTYEIYYDISAQEFFEYMMKYYHRFWNEKRLKEAGEIGLTPIEVAVLASIVEEENHRNEEKAMIAGVYMNRLHKGMLLQADPTVKFAVGDFSLKRILQIHTQTDSPYNTYKYPGLPPAPIRIPASSTMDSVLHYTRHPYLYMCAKADLSGYHDFAQTIGEHNRNAAAYHRAISKIKM